MMMTSITLGISFIVMPLNISISISELE